MHDATWTLGIFQHNCLKIAWATTAQFLFRKGFGKPACPGGRLRKWRPGRSGASGRGHGSGSQERSPCSGWAHLPSPTCTRACAEAVPSYPQLSLNAISPEAGPPALVHFSPLLWCGRGFPEWLLCALVSPSGKQNVSLALLLLGLGWGASGSKGMGGP